jgi:hypothetical protein
MMSSICRFSNAIRLFNRRIVASDFVSYMVTGVHEKRYEPKYEIICDDERILSLCRLPEIVDRKTVVENKVSKFPTILRFRRPMLRIEQAKTDGDGGCIF